MTTAAPQKVHIEVSGFQGFGEFHGSHIDCSADAELMARHPLDGSPLDAATLNLWWGEYWNTGHHTSGGATLGHIYWHITASAHKIDPQKCRVARYIPTDSISLDKLHDAIKAAMLAGQTAVVYLGNAQALPYNERNVHGHFVALGGIDSDSGYLVGNGDDVNALGGKNVIPCRWYSWAQLAAAEINGMIALAKVQSPTSGGPTSGGGSGPVAGVPQGWKDDGATLTAPNGVSVVKGFRERVLAGGWDAANTPFKAEYLTATGSRQDFRYGSLAWTQATNVIAVPIGDELVAAQSKITALESQIAALLAAEGKQPPALTPAQQADLSMAAAVRAWFKGGTLA